MFDTFDTEGLYPEILEEYSPDKISPLWEAMSNGDLDRLKTYCGTRFSTKKWGNTSLPPRLKSLVKDLGIAKYMNRYVPVPTLSCPLDLETETKSKSESGGVIYFRQGGDHYKSIPLRDSIPSSLYEKEDA